MKPVSSQCARSDRDCRDCTFKNCNCVCHKTSERTWRQVLQDHNKRRYFMAPGKSGVWFVMDRGTINTPTTRVIATCPNRLDAYRTMQALNKADR